MAYCHGDGAYNPVTRFLSAPEDQYNRRLRPNHDGPPVEVTVNAFIREILDVDRVKQVSKIMLSNTCL
jgi:hypothetical protein